MPLVLKEIEVKTEELGIHYILHNFHDLQLHVSDAAGAEGNQGKDGAAKNFHILRNFP